MPRSDNECANPLWLGWVKQWLDKEKERGTKAVTTYKKAHDSLKACPLRFEHPSQVIQLTGFGPKLCDRLTEKMKKHCEENDEEMPAIPKKKRKKNAAAGSGDDDDEQEAASPVKKARKTKTYVPKHRSGAYAIILALATLEKGEKTGILKPDIIALAQEHSDASFTIPKGHYTAWKSMDTLLKADLVYEKGRPTRKYYLTEDGWELVDRFKKAEDPDSGRTNNFVSKDQAAEASNSNDDDFYDLGGSPPPAGRKPSRTPAPDKENESLGDDLIPMGEIVTSSRSLPDFRPIILPPGSFTVEMVLDSREVVTKKNRNYIHNELEEKMGAKPLVRALPLGDILWVAKLKDPNYLSDEHGMEGDEVVLDYIVERKRLDDLISSIKDGRFYEQKFRLNKSGLKNGIYLIEEANVDKEYFAEHWAERVQSAIATTQVVSGFFVKKTQKIDESIRYLVRLTAMLKLRYEREPLHVIPTSVVTYWNYLPLLKHLKETQPGADYHATYGLFQFHSEKTKNLTLRDNFLKMLMCTKGISGTKALEIQKIWSTPADFVAAFKALGEGEEGNKKKHGMVSGKCGNSVGNRKIQKAVSTKLAKVWGCSEVEY